MITTKSAALFEKAIYALRMILALLCGATFGFISAVPIAGPVSAVIFSRGMRGKYAEGRGIALGAGLSEACYAFLAFWGFGRFLAELRLAIAIANAVAAVLLFALGIYFFRSKKMRKPIADSKTNPAKEQRAFFLGAGISAVNPSLIATWTVTASTLYSMKLFTYSTLHSAVFSISVWVGIVTWFTIMLKIMEKHRNEINPKILDWGLKIIGLLLLALSFWMLFKVFHPQ